jgi:DNA-binding NarL/FixJ family response regulator
VTAPVRLEISEEPQPHLTIRQTQVLKLVAEGLANKEIADRLQISPKTVEKHWQSVKEKLQMHNAADLARRAIHMGLVQAV